MHIKYTPILRFVLKVVLLSSSFAALAEKQRSVMAIIIDDLGGNYQRGVSLINMAAPITLSILPHKKYSRDLAILAHAFDKEIMLHMPMQAIDSAKDMGPGGLSLSMSQGELVKAFRHSLASVPYISGVNNHMGSLLTSKTMQMQWLMQEIAQMGDLYFVDSRTHHTSVARTVALENNLSQSSRDVFLDHVIDRKYIEQQFEKTINKARRTGFALAIGHPHEETMSVLFQWVPALSSMGIELVPVSEYINLQQNRERLWHASLSPSHKGVKN